MKCTIKEQESCNNEKMTCEGCYYEKDKIIDLMINDLQEYVYNNQCKEEILEFYKNM